MKTATSIEASKKLLSLGIDPETADMCYINGRLEAFYSGCEEDAPAWSLSSLLALMPKGMGIAVGAFPDSDKYTCFTLIDPDIEPTVADTPFTACIDLIEQLVEQGYINTKRNNNEYTNLNDRRVLG